MSDLLASSDYLTTLIGKYDQGHQVSLHRLLNEGPNTGGSESLLASSKFSGVGGEEGYQIVGRIATARSMSSFLDDEGEVAPIFFVTRYGEAGPLRGFGKLSFIQSAHDVLWGGMRKGDGTRKLIPHRRKSEELLVSSPEEDVVAALLDGRFHGTLERCRLVDGRDPVPSCTESGMCGESFGGRGYFDRGPVTSEGPNRGEAPSLGAVLDDQDSHVGEAPGPIAAADGFSDIA